MNPTDTILVVDDDANARDTMSELLKLCGYSVACAENGLVALNEIRTWSASPALILLDLFMPVMDGHTFLRLARQDERLKNVPIVVATAELCAQAFGADAILRKPLKFGVLLSTVRQFVKRAENRTV